MTLPLLDGIASLGDRLFGLVDKFIPDKDKASEMKHELHMTLARLNLAQMAVNAEEAKHSSIFVAGWRPFIGWVCGTALAWQFIGAPVAQWTLTVAGLSEIHSVPQIDSGNLMELVLAMLGMAGLRTYEKQGGIARSRLGK